MGVYKGERKNHKHIFFQKNKHRIKRISFKYDIVYISIVQGSEPEQAIK